MKKLQEKYQHRFDKSLDVDGKIESGSKCKLCDVRDAEIRTYILSNGQKVKILVCKECVTFKDPYSMFESQFFTGMERTNKHCLHESPILYKAIIDLDAKNVLELGTGNGGFSTALLWGVTHVKGRMVTVDIRPGWFSHLKDLALWNGLEFERCKEVSIDDMKYDIEKEDFISLPVDLLMIDTSHQAEHTLNELRKFTPFVRQGGLVFLHDTGSTPSCKEGVMAFVKENTRWKFHDVSDPRSSYGLGLLKNE